MSGNWHILAAGLDPQLILLAGVALVLVALLWNSARRRSRASRVDGRASQFAARHNSRMEKQAADDLHELMMRLEELTREICGQIDTRYAKLERVIAEADRKLAELRAAEGQSAQPAGDDAPQSAPPPADPRHVAIYERFEAGQSAVDIARSLGITAGEVELVISLERSRRNHAGRGRRLVADEAVSADEADSLAEPDAEPTAAPRRRRTKKAGLDERA